MRTRRAEGWTVAEIAEASGVSTRTVHKWLACDGADNRSSRAARVANRLSEARIEAIAALRRLACTRFHVRRLRLVQGLRKALFGEIQPRTRVAVSPAAIVAWASSMAFLVSLLTGVAPSRGTMCRPSLLASEAHELSRLLGAAARRGRQS